MKVGVQLAGLEPKLADAIAIHLNTKWDPAEVLVFRNSVADGEFDGLLIFGDGRPAPSARALVTDSVDLRGGAGGTQAPLGDILFQADAKLGRLTKSYLTRQSTRSFLTRDAKFSRRELLAGARKGFRRYSGLPFLLNEKCEARLGCTKCIDVCPSRALQAKDGSIIVSDADCTVCGICMSICPTGAVQMPEFPDAALDGLLDEIDDSTTPNKTLVLTCDTNAIEREPGMVVEQISTVGMLGPRQIAAAAASSLGGVAVVCPDGKCTGKDSAKTAVNAVGGSVAVGPLSPLVGFFEGGDGMQRLSALHQSSKARPRRAPRTGDRWKDYVSDLACLLSADSPTSGLGLIKLTIAESCTLCSACGKFCPHGSLKLDDSSVSFDASTCTGCGLCVSTCPEHSIALSPSSGRLSQVMQSEKVYEDELVVCAKCGAPIGTARFVNKVNTALGPDAKLVRYCPACKRQEIVGMLFGGMRRE